VPNHKTKPPRRINVHEYSPDPVQQLIAADRSVKHRLIQTLRIGKAGYRTAVTENNYVQD